MRVLINYDNSESRYLPALAYVLKSLGYKAVSTTETLSPAQIVHKAQVSKSDAVIICNEKTLRNLTPHPKATLDNYRGSLLTMSIPCVVINQLHQIYSVPYGKFLLEKDLAKVVGIKERKDTGREVSVFKYTLLDRQNEYSTILERMKDAILIAYDIETKTFLENLETLQAGETLITCASWSCLYSNGQIETYVLPLIDFGVNHWTTAKQYELAILFLRAANALPIPTVMHNGLYDCTHSIVYNAYPANYCLDTMVMAHSQYAELPKSLDFVASIHLDDYCQWKDDSEIASKDKDIRKYWGYNGKDTWYTLRICMSQLRTMPKYAKGNFAESFKLVFPSLYCAFEGFKVDTEEQDKLRDKAQKEIDKHKELLQTYVANKDFNPGSWQQVQKYIYKVFGAVHPKVGKSASGTDEKNLTEVAEQHPLLALLVFSILEYRGNVKARSNYFSFLLKKDRLLWALNPWGAETGRMSCLSSNFWCGTQVQNIPAYAKSQLVADKGFTILEADNKQSEGRCTAYLSQDLSLIKAIEDEVYDFYKTLGTLFFNIPYAQVTTFFRNKVLKKIVHGTNYMMGAKTFKENIGAKILHETASILGYRLVPKPSTKSTTDKTILGFSKELLEKYHVPFPRVRKWYDEVKIEVKTTRMLVSPLGYVRYFFGDIEKDHNMLRSAVAHAPQNLSVSILNKSFWRIYKTMVVQPQEPLKLGDFRLKAQIHDSNLAQYRTGLDDIVKERIAECMDNPIVVHNRTLRIPIDIKTGTNWAACKD
jgi:DNA polymerase I-like protein with 3'-5' exonuclease and polymerase domains